MKPKPLRQIRERREAAQQAKKSPPRKEQSFWRKWEFRIGASLGLAGLLLTALQYQARPTASLGTPLQPRDALTTPIIISNDGLTDLHDMRFVSFFKNIDYEGDFHLSDSVGNRTLENIDTLLVGEKQDVLPYQLLVVAENRRLLNIDFTLVVYFRPAYWPWTKRRFFRFQLATNSDGTTRLRDIAAGDIEREFDAATKRLDWAAH